MLKDPESMMSGGAANVGIVREICFTSAQHIYTVAQCTRFVLHSARRVGSMNFLDERSSFCDCG